MTKYNEDLLKLKAHIISVVTARSMEIHGKVQILCCLLDHLNVLKFIFWPLSSFQWPEELIQKLSNSPVGFCDGTTPVSICYNAPLVAVPPELRARRGKIISAVRNSRIAYNHLKPWIDLRRDLNICKEALGKVSVTDVSSVIEAIEQRLGSINAEIKKQEKVIKTLRPEGEDERNELLCRDIARSFGVEDAPDLVLRFGVRDSAYPLPIRGTPLEPSK